MNKRFNVNCATKIYLLLIIIFIMTINSVNGCWTDKGKYGECVNIKSCKHVMKILQRRPPLQVYDEIRQAHCGFEGDDPKICCEVESVIHQRLNIPEAPETPSTTPAPNSIYVHPNLKLLDHEICGPVGIESRIYGGTTTRLFEFPWMALLAYNVLDQGQQDFRCGGTIINKKYIMTAAHCVKNLPENLKLIGVRVGEHNLATERDCEGYDHNAANICAEKYQDFDIEEIRVHSDYSTSTLQNDIALVRINGVMNFEPASVRPICLPLTPSAQLTSITGLVTGWGSTAEHKFRSETLQKVILPILSLEKCISSYRDQPYLKIWYKQLCAGGIDVKDSCNGDSGGPLQSLALYKGKLKFVQHGIVSFGRKHCAVEDSPGVYTNVAYYVDWILDNMRV